MGQPQKNTSTVPCFIEECFLEWNGTQAHNVAFYYLIELDDGSDIPNIDEFVSHKDNCNVVLGWMPIEQLVNLTIYPDFIKETIYELDAPPRASSPGHNDREGK